MKKFYRIIKKQFRSFKYGRKTPVYIPVFKGELLRNKNVLITGGAGGIGFGIAKLFIENGATVVLAGRKEGALQSACDELNAKSDDLKAYYVVLDICNVELIREKLMEAANLLPDKRIDILVNNAGVSAGASTPETLERDFDMTLETNLKGTYFMAQEFSKYLIDNEIKGNILNVSSVSGNRPAISPYMVSKWGVNGLTEGLAKRLIKYGIVVNAIAPGPTAAGMIKNDGCNLAYDRSPAGRYVDCAEVANLALFLVSDTGRMIVGETISISGGCGTLTFDDIKY